MPLQFINTFLHWFMSYSSNKITLIDTVIGGLECQQQMKAKPTY